MPKNPSELNPILEYLAQELEALERETLTQLETGTSQRNDADTALDRFREFLSYAKARLSKVRSIVSDLSGVTDDVTEILIEQCSELGSLQVEAESWNKRLSFSAKNRNGLADFISSSTSAAILRAKQWLKSVLIPTLRSALGKLWRLISGLLRPKEWKLGGELSSGVFGLAKSSVEITFGP